MSINSDSLQLFDDPVSPAPEGCMAVLVPYPVDKAYDYMVPAGTELQPGDYVTVPLGGREVAAVVWGEPAGDVKPAKLKAVVLKHDMKPMPKVMRDFIDWVADYTMSPRGFVLKMALSVQGALEPPKPAQGYRISSAFTPPPLMGGGREGGELLQKAQNLRKNMTEAEKKLWHALNKKQLGVKFRRQVPLEGYVFDFMCFEKRMIIELDGGQHAESSAHEDRRNQYLEDENFRVLRFWNHEVFENFDGVVETIASALELPTPPKPSPGQGRAVRLSEKQQQVLDVLQDGLPRIAAQIAKEAGVSAGVVKTLAGKGVLEETQIFNPAPCKKPDPFREGPKLSEDQDAVADQLKAAVRYGQYSACLLDGVTGAGKTEVYFEAVAEALKKGKQVLIMLPEIALSNAFLDRFQQRFGCAPALWHSHLSSGVRKTTWRGVAEGHSKVVVGARSALFLPYQDLGLIIVDEEHDPAYKQEDGVIYNARDMAVARAHMGGFPTVLVSATPSLETIHNAWPEPLGKARYQHLHLTDRFGGARMPEIETIDMRVDKPDAQHFISSALKKEMVETLQRGEQVLLFLNRRGYAPLTLCRSCGHRMECPRCTAWLVEHKAAGPPSRGFGATSRLQCHHCGFAAPVPKTCPECGDTDSLAACGPGVERVYEEARAYFRDANILMLASDTAENNDQLRKMLADIKDDKIDIIIGTQIIAKGHHFPNLTLVGVIDADLGLAGGELRAAERCYQLLHQVAGRAGRAEKKGRVLLQSFMPDHRIMKALSEGARDPFLETEAAEREAAHMPPYSRLVGIIISGRDEGQVVEIAKALGQSAPQGQGVMTLGPAPAPFARLRGKFRYRLLVQADKNLNIQKSIQEWIAGVKCPSTVRIYVDIDPQSFL